jgi:hypothetical protein
VLHNSIKGTFETFSAPPIPFCGTNTEQTPNSKRTVSLQPNMHLVYHKPMLGFSMFLFVLYNLTETRPEVFLETCECLRGSRTGTGACLPCMHGSLRAVMLDSGIDTEPDTVRDNGGIVWDGKGLSVSGSLALGGDSKTS